MDSLFARHQSLNGNKVAHVISNGKFTSVYPVKDKTSPHAAQALEDFCDDVGIPQELWTDGGKECVGRNTEFRRTCNKRGIRLFTTEPGKKNQNHAAERDIGELKKRWRRRRTKKDASHRLWDCGMVHEAELMKRYARGRDGRTGYEEVTGNAPDISEGCDFEFYDLVWYRPHGKLTDAQKSAELGLWIGVSHRVGSDMSHWILPKTGVVGSYTTVQHVTKEDYANPQHRGDIDEFYATIKERLNDDNFELKPEHGSNYMHLDDDPEDPAYPLADSPADCESEFPDAEPDEEDTGIDHYLGAEVVLDTEQGPRFARVVERVKHPDGRQIGSPHRNPMLDTREHFVEFPDQSRSRCTANTIAENLFSQCDTEGHRFRVIEEITDHRTTEEALVGEDCFRVANNGQKVPRKTTKGHEFCVKCRGEECEWLPVKQVKDGNPIEAAEFAKSNGLD
jgi:hypothetical protein